ncbi:carbonic anhydrase [Sphingomonas montana]|uniref:carbonic anhydrase n=1 Tax=Sphingomonas montana TaxID=1843236 RepID=UPI00096E0F39|nr:carbonic anhydrase [Sphingomonas montana]
MKETQQLILANMAWAAEQHEFDPEFFTRQMKGQRPEFLWIGCSDSRVAPDQITQAPPGGLYIHRNIANLVHVEDLNLMAVLQFAVETLEVNDIIVCGHYGCTGIIGALDTSATGPISDWLANVRTVHADHRAEIDAMPDRESRVNRLVEYNVRAQLLHLAATPPVAAAFAAGRKLKLHGWVYDLRDGLLKPLMDIDAQSDLDALAKLERVLL